MLLLSSHIERIPSHVAEAAQRLYGLHTVITGVEGGPPMLPPFIIEQIRKREKEEREHQAEQPRLELPLERRRRPESIDDESDRGVVIVDLG
jgi:hypothetical protein